MIENFKMQIGEADFLRVLNEGIRQLGLVFLQNLIEDGDRVVDVQYSRSTKQYTLVFQSGQRLRVAKSEAKRKKEAEKAAAQ